MTSNAFVVDEVDFYDSYATILFTTLYISTVIYYEYNKMQYNIPQ